MLQYIIDDVTFVNNSKHLELFFLHYYTLKQLKNLFLLYKSIKFLLLQNGAE